MSFVRVVCSLFTSAILIQKSIVSARFPVLSVLRMLVLTQAHSFSLKALNAARCFTPFPTGDLTQLRHSDTRMREYSFCSWMQRCSASSSVSIFRRSPFEPLLLLCRVADTGVAGMFEICVNVRRCTV